MVAAALQPYMDARSAVSGASFARPLDRAGLALCNRLSDSLDRCLVHLAEPLPAKGLAVLALGGYGRREQCRHSDVDLTLLFARRPSTEKAHALLYPLWDSNLRVGHSARTVDQVMLYASDNVQTCTALLDARLVYGDAQLFGRFRKGLRKFLRRHYDWLRQELAAGRAEALEQEPWQLQDPDLKAGRGGLRSLQIVHWLALAAALAEDRDPPPLAPELAEARERLLATRNALHSLEDRPNDTLRRDLLPTAASLLHADPDEWSMGLSESMRTLDAAAAEALAAPPPAPPGRRWLPWSRRPAAEPPPEPAEDAAAPPAGADDGRGDLERLTALLGEAGPGGTLDPLPPAEWLGRLLPEWETLRHRPHAAPFHVHRMDVHAWRTVAEARRAAEADEDGAGTPEAAAGVENERLLLLAALLHDIGKGHGGQHEERGAVIAERFAARAGLGEDDGRRLASAVRLHLLLPDAATKRDISDDRVIREVVTEAGDLRMLNLLYVLAVADARASGPDAWDAWKARLLRSLYTRAAESLSDVSLRTVVSRRRRAAIQGLAGWMTAQAIEAHLDTMPLDYLLSTEPQAIGHHLELIAEALIEAAETGSEHLAPALYHDRVDGIERLTIVADNQHGVLSAVSGTLAAHHLSMLGGSAYTRDDGVAVDVIHIGDMRGWGIGERRWDRVTEAIKKAIVDEFPIEERLAEARASANGGAEPAGAAATKVGVDSARAEGGQAIIEIQTPDRLGLRYAITKALGELAMDIRMAKINTFGDEIVDAFHVRGVEAEGDAGRIVESVTGAVDAFCGEDDAPPAGATR